MAADVKLYPELKRILGREWDDYRRRNGRISLREAAELMGMKSPSALHSWLRGERLPKTKNIKTLANFFHAGDDARQQRLENEIKVAVTAKPVASLIDPLESLVNGLRQLAVGVVEYEPFSGKDSDFFNQIFDRFAAFANLSELGVVTRPVNLDEAQTMLCDTGTLDVALGILQTPDRALRMRFFSSPIRIPVNAVMMSGTGDRVGREKVGEVLWKRKKDEKPERSVYPIINEKEVGGLHVRNFLNISPNRYRAVEYKVESYAEALSELHEQRGSAGPVPVIVADELMCLRVLQRINAAAPSPRRTKNQPGAAEMVSDEARNARPDKSPPRYRLCFAVNRAHRKWIDYLEDAFEIFLDSNAELVASHYRDLLEDINGELQAVLPGDGKKNVAGGWLGLEDGATAAATGPWAEIIARAKPTGTTTGRSPQPAERKGRKK